MMNKTKILLALSLVSFLNVAQAADKFTLGTATIKNSDMVSIRFDKCEKVSALRIKTDKEIWLSKIVASFDSSKSANYQTYNVQSSIEKEGKSQWIELGKKNKCVSAIDIYANPSKNKANIEIIAKRK